MLPESEAPKELDLFAFKARLRVGREFEVASGSMRLRCLLPTPITERLTFQRFPLKGQDGVAVDRAERWAHELAIASIESWDGVYVRDIVRGDKHGDTPVPCNPETARLLLEFRLDLNDLVTGEIMERRRARDDASEEATKNLNGASPGSDPETRPSAFHSSETPSAVQS